jgi:hypothetical protein
MNRNRRYLPQVWLEHGRLDLQDGVALLRLVRVHRISGQPEPYPKVIQTVQDGECLAVDVLLTHSPFPQLLLQLLPLGLQLMNSLPSSGHLVRLQQHEIPLSLIQLGR